MAARGINPLHASEVLARATDEMRTWKRLLADDDPRVVLQAMMFLVSMRDGKPAQQINVTSQNLTVSVDDIAKARAIVAELRGASALTLTGADVRQQSNKPMLGAYDAPDGPGDTGEDDVQAIDNMER
jgi:hypothetical protein